jgi:hypothetical protein
MPLRYATFSYIEGRDLHVGTHLVHDSHARPLYFPTGTHYKPRATDLYIGQTDIFSPAPVA